MMLTGPVHQSDGSDPETNKVIFWVSQSASCIQREYLEQCFCCVGRNLQRCRGSVFLEPVAMAGAGDRDDVVPPRQDPGDRELCWSAVLSCSMLFQLLDQREVAAQIVALKPRH